MKEEVVRTKYFMVIEIQEDNCVPRRCRLVESKKEQREVLKGGSKGREPRTCQKTEYRGKLGELRGNREDLLLQRL